MDYEEYDAEQETHDELRRDAERDEAGWDAFDAEKARLEKALAAGNPVWLVKDGIADDECIPSWIKERLYALLATAAQDLWEKPEEPPRAIPETVAATAARVRAALEDGGRVELTVRSKQSGAHVYVTLTCKKRKPGGGYFARNTEQGRVGLADADRVEVRDTNLDWPNDRVGAYLPAKGRFYGDQGVDAARLWAGRNVFAWALGDHDLAGLADVFIATRCCRCGHKLKHPESVERLIGPECASKILKGQHAKYAAPVQMQMAS